VTRQTLPPKHPGAHVSASREGSALRLALSGRFDAPGTAVAWDQALRSFGKGQFTDISADCSGITDMDGAGVALLLKLREESKRTGCSLDIRNLAEEYHKLLGLTWDCELPQWDEKEKERRGFARIVGDTTEDMLVGLHEMISFVGESTVMIITALRHPRIIRWKDVLLSCINVGVNSLFIILLIGFLMGLIMSFQSAVTLEKFGGEIFVPNMLGLVMFREMGPLVTAILLAARSGSAFAAEIGTMKINEELDALTTMGLSPMRFLVLPKLLSTLAMVPLMTLFFILASLVGGAVVMLSMGFPLVTFTSRVFSYLDYSDFWGGMFKAFVFSVLVAGVGCLRGIQTESSASAVGLSTTSAVVSGIILIAFADGIFAMTFYYLGL